MEFSGMRPIARGLAIPESFAGKIAAFGTCDFTESEAELLTSALSLVNKYFKDNPPPTENFRLNILIFDTPTLTINFPVTPGKLAITLGYYFDAILFPVGLWRDAKLSKDSILFTMLEELSHCIWHIIDEDTVKLHVVNMLKYLNPKADAKAFLNRITLESILYSAGLPGAEIVK